MKKVLLTAIIAGSILTTWAFAGSLTPSGAVSSTMHSLADVYDSIVGTFDSSGVVANQNGTLLENLKYIEANLGGGGVTSNSLDFDELVNSMNLDATTTIASHGFGLDLTSTNLELSGTASLGNTLFIDKNETTSQRTSVNLNGTMKINGQAITWFDGTTTGLEMGFDTNGNALTGSGVGGTGYGLLQSFNRGTLTWEDLWLRGGNIVFDTGASLSSEGRRMTITPSGNVGIGTVTPGAKLDVSGAASISGNFGINTNKFYVNATSGNVGIGTVAPDATLKIAGTASISGHAAIGNAAGIDYDKYYDYSVPIALNVSERFTDLSSYPMSILSTMIADPTSTGPFDGGSNIIQNMFVPLANTQDLYQMIDSNVYFEHDGSGTITNAYGVNSQVAKYNPGTITNSYGGYFVASLNGGAGGTVINAYGLAGSAVAAGAGNVTQGVGGLFYIYNSDGATFTDSMGVKIASPSFVSGGGGITNGYGLKIQNQTNAKTANAWNIYSEGADSRNYFGGSASISMNLEVAGTASLSALTVGGVPYTPGGGSRPASNSLDWDEIVNNMTLDANTTVASAGFTLDLGSTKLTTGIILPDMTSAVGTLSFQTVGTNAAWFHDIYVESAHLGNSSLYLNGVKVLSQTGNVMSFSADSGQTLALSTAGSGNLTINAQGTGNLQLLATQNIVASASNGILLNVPATNPSQNLNLTNTSVGGQININATGSTGRIVMNGNDSILMTAPNIKMFGTASASFFNGSGLSSCAGATQKLLWDGGLFSCGTDQTGGGGGGGSALEIKDDLASILNPTATISFSGNAFTVTSSGSEAVVKLDWTNGPASRSTANTWTALNTFSAGATVSGNFEVRSGTASISNALWVSPTGNTGNVGIGTSAPWAQFAVNGGTTGKFSVGDSSTNVTLGIGGGVAANPSYANAGGTGNRTASITVTSDLTVGQGAISTLVDGDLAATTFFFSNQTIAGKYIKFDFGVGVQKVITESKYYQSTTAAQGTWQWQGSNDNSTWANIGNNFALGGATTTTMTELALNATGYRYYRMLGVSGSWAQNPWDFEFEFKIDDVSVGGAYALLQAYKVNGVTANDIVMQSIGGNIGIGTANVDARFELSGTGITTGTVASISATALTTGDVFSITVPASTSTSGRYLLVKDVNGVAYASLGNGGRLALRRDITSHGANSTCTGAGSGCIDYAESFPTTDTTLEPGDIVAVDPSDSAHVKKADASSTPLGIVSTNPAALITGSGLLSGSSARQNPDGTVPIALAGRVPVRISAPVHAGDHLVLSPDVAGTAVTATLPGTTVGIALEDSDGPTVLAFVNTSYWAPSVPPGELDLSQNSISDNLFGAIVRKFADLFHIVFRDGSITTQQLCLDDVCMNRDQLKELMDRARISAPAPTPEPTPTPTPEPSDTPLPSDTPTPTPLPSDTPTPTPTPVSVVATGSFDITASTSTP